MQQVGVVFVDFFDFVVVYVALKIEQTVVIEVVQLFQLQRVISPLWGWLNDALQTGARLARIVRCATTWLRIGQHACRL